MSNNKKSSGKFGKGYYIALILCAAAIGVSGYVYYRNASQNQEVVQQREEFMVVKVKIDAVENTLPVELHGKVLESDEFFRHYPPPFL